MTKPALERLRSHSFSSSSRWRKRDVAKLPTEVAIDKIRMDEFVDDQLTLSLRDAAGNVTATTWRRAP